MTVAPDEKTLLLEYQLQKDSELQLPRRESPHWLWKTINFFRSLFCTSCRRVDMPEVMDPAQSRKQRVDTGAQSLGGEFELLDLLSIQSTSGSIGINIHPQPADKQNPVPAELMINSNSGTINVNFAAFDAPERDYRVSVSSRSGSVGGYILHGRNTSISSNSGSIDVQITPYAAKAYESSLRTSTMSSTQEISVLSPENEPGVSIKGMSSSHNSNSGSLTLYYPKEWEGTIEGHTGSGNIQLHGGNLDIIRQNSISKAGHYVLAKKGKGNSTLSFQTGSGSVDIYFEG